MSEELSAAIQLTSRRLRRFERRFGMAHLEFACHAALPLALTPDLLYRLWKLFGLPNDVPWIAVADLLLADFCEPVGHAGEDLFELSQDERAELLRLLETRFGRTRVDEVAHFVFDYALRLLDSDLPGVSDVAYAQRWTAQAFTEPAQAARELTQTLAGHVTNGNVDEIARVAALVELSIEQLAGFPDLLDYARGVLARFTGNETEATERLKQFGPGDSTTVAGERAPLPRPTTEEPAPQPQAAPPAWRIAMQQLNIFELNIRAEGADQCRVEARSSSAIARALTPSPLTDSLLARDLATLQRQLTTETISRIGNQLYRTMFRGDIETLYGQAYAADEHLILSLQFAQDESNLAVLPWEFISDPVSGRQAFERFSTVRNLPLPTPPSIPDHPYPLRVLVTLSGDDPTGAIDHLRQYGDAIQIVTRSYLDLSLLRQDLNAGVDIWHHIGDLAEFQAEQTLLIRNRSGELEPRSAREIATLVNAAPPLIVFLQGAPRSTAQPEPNTPSSSLASMLVRAGAAACLSLLFELSPDQNRVLMETFYTELMTGAPIEACVAAARRALFKTSDSYAWAAPSLTIAMHGLALNAAPREVDRATLARTLLDTAYARRDDSYQQGLPFHRYALANGLGFPLTRLQGSSDASLQANQEWNLERTTFYQPFARDVLYRERDGDAVLRLSELQRDQPRYQALLDAATVETIPDGAGDLWLRTALREGIGLPLGQRFSLTLEGSSHTVQAFALDALVDWQTETYDIFRAGGLAAATTPQAARLGAAVLAEVYRRQGTTYHPEWAAHRVAVAEGLGLPLSDVLQLAINGVIVHAQVFATDVLYVIGTAWESAGDTDIGRLSRLVTEGLLADLMESPPERLLDLAELNRAVIVLEPNATIADALARLPVDRAARAASYLLIPAEQERYLVARWDEIERLVGTIDGMSQPA